VSTNTKTTNDPKADEVRCAAYGLIAHGFRYPDDPWLSTLTDPQRWKDWMRGLSETHRDAVAPLSKLREVVEGLNQRSGLDHLQEQFAFLFGHSVRGKCPPYELEFGKSEVIQRASDLADISGFYSAFGMELAGEVSERPDHLSVEAEFMAVLCAKAACGIESEEEELVETVLGAQRQFLKSHLGRWLPAFSRRVQESQPCDFYGGLSDFASAFVTCDCQRIDVSLGSPYLQLRPVDPVQEATQSCGVPGECDATGGERLTQLKLAASDEGH